ncbi:DUF1427 family protein [Microbulbifer sp. SAOS-129_SWC]|uniref:DUF1427 family protein n=1 Tax=Microbulbifer sp. SAOS-129_SWC TaxID=3145235 RepID=UPI003217FDE7
MTNTLLGIALGLIIGAACRWFDLPLPAPPKLIGALLVVAMSCGFAGTDLLIERHFFGVFHEQTEARSADAQKLSVDFH